MDTANEVSAAHAAYVLRLGDSALVLGQRLSEWCGHGPVLEEDIALANIALDLIGQARLLLAHAGRLEGRGRDEDALAYWREQGEFCNYTLLELPNTSGAPGMVEADGDYATTIVRNLLFSRLQLAQWRALADSADADLAAIAAKAVKEARMHWDHARDWTLRLGDGTDESHRRMQQALDRLWPYTNEFWTDDEVERAVAAAGIAPLTATLREDWEAALDETLAQATLRRPEASGFVSSGKLGRHSEHLGHMLATMQSVARAHPGAQW